jgi:two-component system response regulator AtoC
MAGSGTVFLDEIGDTSLGLQAKLLRVLEDREFYPVGSEVPRRTKARTIAATHRSLEEMVRDGVFREDLFFRLKVVELHVPPLRDRRSDIPLLVRHLLSKAASEINRPVPNVPPEVMAALVGADWPGNVRELENVLTRAVLLCRGGTLSEEDVLSHPWSDTAAADPVERSGSPKSLTLSGEEAKDGTLAEIEARYVQEVLVKTGGNKSAAARVLQISRPTLNRIIKEHELFVPNQG